VAEPLIIARIEEALERMRVEGVAVRSINLCKTDHDALNAALTAAWNEGCKRSERAKIHAHSFRDHPVRPALHSVIYSKQGVGFTVKRKLSHRTRAASQ
jgi:hypothetical protein